MTFAEVLRFEVGYQSRRPWTWMYVLALLGISFAMTTQIYADSARAGGFFVNAPFVIASVTVLTGVMGLLVTAALAGDAAARDVQTRMHPLVYTSPVSKGAYLGGRFLAAFGLNALILLAVQVGLVVSPVMPGVPQDLLGPFQPGAYLGAYLLIALPNAFVVTALLFSMSVLSRRAIAGYLGAVFVFFATMLVWNLLAVKMGQWELARILDPLAFTIMREISMSSTAAEKNALSVALSESLLVNRAVWLGIALGVLALTHVRFRVEHVVTRNWWRRLGRRAGASPGSSPSFGASPSQDLLSTRAAPIVARTFGSTTRAHQVLAIAAQSFREIALSWGGLVLAVLTTTIVVLGPRAMNHLGVPLFPTTQQMTRFVGNTGEILWTIVPLLTVFYVGELVWRDRETGLSEIADAAPVREWVRLSGRFAGLGLVFVAYQTLIIVACMVVQARLGYRDFELGLYARTFVGLQLPVHLLFAVLAFTVHVLVNHKYVGHMVVLTSYLFTAFAPTLGIEHHLLVYGAGPSWMYSDMSGFGPFVAPWMWFKLYWAAWAMLLAVVATLFWVRSREVDVASRLQLARRRLTRRVIGAAAAAITLIVTIGGFIFYNTNVLNAYETAADRTERRAEYERRYGRYRGVSQPQLGATTLRVEIYPDRRAVDIRGTYRLVNMSGVAIDSIHLAPDWEVATGPMSFDRPVTCVLDDEKLGHRIYALEAPLMPGDSVRLDFSLRFRPRGFTNGPADPSVTPNGTFFEGNDWLPAVGYQSDLELSRPQERSAHGLPPRAAVRSVNDVAARRDMTGAEHIAFDAVVGTAEDEVAVAPGTLRRTWTEKGRRYFHYATDVPIRNDFAIYSAAYAVREARWRPSSGSGQDVAIQIFHHPRHLANVDRMVRSVQASLDHFTRELGPYPYRQVRLVEHASQGNSLHGAPINVEYEEGFSLFNPDADPRGIDFSFAVVAHEMAHQWWGNQLSPANVEGGPLLSESLAWYSALSVVRESHGEDHLTRLLSMMRESYLSPRARAGVPLLRVYDRFLAYRKGPFAMYALREYMGADRVNTALRRLFEAHRSAAPPLPTSLDLYRELRAVTPDSLRYLLVDLFEANTFWELETKRVAVDSVPAGGWRVTLDVSARKVVVDTAGVAAHVPMNDLIEVGVFGEEKGERRGEPLYLRMHRIHSGEQRIVLTVPRRPVEAGIDPRHLLIDTKVDDNLKRAAP